ncbi:MAG TPA: cation diffusion facilitator family transporter [Terriglobia bacterium]|nr:cation diffusion facilitator family transporter [Terriglobia bacterium]
MRHTIERTAVRTAMLGIFVNGTLATAKFIGGILGNSYALIADAVESMTDIFSSFVVWRGLSVAILPPDSDHPYGHGKAEPLAASFVSLTLLAAALGIAIQAVREILRPHMIPSPFTLWLLLAVVVIKESLFRFAFRVGNQTSSSAVRADAWHHRSDAITSAAAGIGIAIALWGGKGYESADDWAALFASGFIAWNGIRLLKPAVDELMDALPSEALQKEIVTIALSCHSVLAVEKVLARKTGFVYWVDMHLEVPKDMTVEEAHAVSHVVKDRIREELPKITEVSIHVEPYPQKDLGLTPAKVG